MGARAKTSVGAVGGAEGWPSGTHAARTRVAISASPAHAVGRNGPLTEPVCKSLRGFHSFSAARNLGGSATNGQTSGGPGSPWGSAAVAAEWEFRSSPQRTVQNLPALYVRLPARMDAGVLMSLVGKTPWPPAGQSPLPGVFGRTRQEGQIVISLPRFGDNCSCRFRGLKGQELRAAAF